jgi:hypothetical protein
MQVDYEKHYDPIENGTYKSAEQIEAEVAEILIPAHLKPYLGRYGKQLFDGWCGECTQWGFAITKHCSEDIWSELHKYGSLECAYPNWFLITKQLSITDAIEQYGNVTELETGKRGGFKTVTYGTRKFMRHELDPRKIIDIDPSIIKVI